MGIPTWGSGVLQGTREAPETGGKILCAFTGEQEHSFLYSIYQRVSDPTNVKKLCIMAPRGLDLMDIQAQSQPAIPTGLTPNAHLPL